MSELQCYILSGVSGAGKSTWIQNQAWADKADVHSADHYFVKDGVYRFDPKLLPEAHGACLRDFIHGVRPGWRAKEMGLSLEDQPIQVVDNTNTTNEEIAPYYSVAKAYGYKVTLVTLRVNLELAAKRNTHGVPLAGIQAMQDRISARRIPRFWDLKEETYLWHQDAWLKV
jgi:predicted ABC-type ATPase